MSVEGLCAICESSTADYGCDRCGRMVCAKHYETDDGMCTACLAQTGGRPGGGSRQGDDRPDGVDEYQF